MLIAMDEDPNETKVRLWLALINIINWLSGWAMLMLAVMSIWVYSSSYMDIMPNGYRYMPALYVYIIVGGLTIATGTVGCVLILEDNRRYFFKVYCAALFVVLLVQVAGLMATAVSLQVDANEKREAFYKGFHDALKEYDRTTDADNLNEKFRIKRITFSIDDIQVHLQCCGVDNASDWRYTAWQRRKTVGFQDGSYVPQSCCKQPPCEATLLESNHSLINFHGCYKKVIHYIQGLSKTYGAALLGFTALQMIELCVCAFLCRRLVQYEEQQEDVYGTKIGLELDVSKSTID